MAELVHPELEATLRMLPDRTLRGVDEFKEFVREFVTPRSVFEVVMTAVDALDERRVIAQGRLRWMDDERVLRDDPVVWALELDEARLRRITATRSVPEAEALLATAPLADG